MRLMCLDVIPRGYCAWLKMLRFTDFGMLGRHGVADFLNIAMLRPTLRLVRLFPALPQKFYR